MENSTDKIKIKEAIIKTIAFFDIFDYPLTADELWRYLWLPNNQGNISQNDVELALGELGDQIESQDGFFYLKGRRAIVSQRLHSAVWSEKKIRIIQRAARWLKYLSGVRMVAAVNSIVLGSVKEDSDIDLFIVAASGRIWLVRLAVTALVQLLGVRRHGKHVSDRLCLSFYITDDRLNLSAVRYPSDPYFYFWLATLEPIYDDNCYEKFIQSNNWILDCLPNFYAETKKQSHLINDNWLSGKIKQLNALWFYTAIGGAVERFVRTFQRKKMARNLTSLAGQADTRVIISDAILKFHESDRRQEFRQRWEDSCKLILAKL